LKVIWPLFVAVLRSTGYHRRHSCWPRAFAGADTDWEGRWATEVFLGKSIMLLLAPKSRVLAGKEGQSRR